MTLSRILSIACFVFLFINWGWGQEPTSLSQSAQLTELQMMALDSLAADTTRGELMIPNVFSPNDDQINDYFEVQTDGETVYDFTIFSRAGMRVFHSNSPRIFWDGRTNGGESMGSGIYYFVIEERGSEDPYQKAGFIYLYR